MRLRSVLVHPPLPRSPAPAVTRGRYHEFGDTCRKRVDGSIFNSKCVQTVLAFFAMWQADSIIGRVLRL